MIKTEGLPDYTPPTDADSMGGGESNVPYWGQDGVHEIYRDWHKVLAEYDGDRALCGEAWMPTLKETALWVRPDEMHQTFNFPYLMTAWDAKALGDVIRESLDAFGAVGAPSTWVLSNHDVVRHATRLALTIDNPQGEGIGPNTPDKPDTAIGLARARAATTLMLALPGSAYLYQGEELRTARGHGDPGRVPSGPDLVPHERRALRPRRLPCAAAVGGGGPGVRLQRHRTLVAPQPADWAAYARDVEEVDPASTLALYKRLLAGRREFGFGTGSLVWEDAGPDAVAFRRGEVHVLANLGTAPLDLPEGAVVLLRSQPFDGAQVPVDTAVWYTTA